MKVFRQILEIVYTLAVRIPHPPEFILVQVCLDSVECVCAFGRHACYDLVKRRALPRNSLFASWSRTPSVNLSRIYVLGW